jgi:hypothetical protein
MQLSCYGIFAIVAAACESVASKDGIQHLSIEHSTRHKTDTDGISRSYDGKRNKLHVLTNETICASQQVESEIKTSSATADLNASNLLQIIGFFSRSMYRLPVFGVMFSCAFGQKISGHATTSRNLKLDLSFREGLYALSIYLAMGVIAYSFVLENWSVIDSLYFTCTCFTTGEYRILRWGKIFEVSTKLLPHHEGSSWIRRSLPFKCSFQVIHVRLWNGWNRFAWCIYSSSAWENIGDHNRIAGQNKTRHIQDNSFIVRSCAPDRLSMPIATRATKRAIAR